MAKGSIMDRTPTEMWYLIQDRAADTRAYTRCNLKQALEETAYQQPFKVFCQLTPSKLAYQRAEITQYKAELDKEIAKINGKLEEVAENTCEPKSVPEPVQVYVDDEEVSFLMKEQDDEDKVDAELQIVQMKTEDVPREEWISPPCSDKILEQNLNGKSTEAQCNIKCGVP